MTLVGALAQLAFFVWLLFVLVHEWAWVLLAIVVAIRLAPPVKRQMAARHEVRRQEIAALIQRADEENRLVMNGDVRGVYGRYAPPPELYGMGFAK